MEIVVAFLPLVFFVFIFFIITSVAVAIIVGIVALVKNSQTKNQEREAQIKYLNKQIEYLEKQLGEKIEEEQKSSNPNSNL